MARFTWNAVSSAGSREVKACEGTETLGSTLGICPLVVIVAERSKPVKEGRTRVSWLRGGYELMTKKRNQVLEGQQRAKAAR